MASVPSLTLRERRSLRRAVIDELTRTDEQIAALTRTFDDIVEAASLTSTDDEHDPDGSTIAFERAQIGSLLRQARSDRGALNATLDHIDDSDFGTCEHCHVFIGIERLLALPSTRRCIACAR